MKSYSFSEYERKRLIQAIHCAIDYEDSFIDAHKTQWSNRKGNIYKVIPREFLSIVNRSKRAIIAWNKLKEKLKGKK